MRPTEPLPLHHSWPLYDLREHLAPVVLDQDIAGNEAALADRGLGLWHCNLADNSISWTQGVYDIFGLEPGSMGETSALAVSRLLGQPGPAPRAMGAPCTLGRCVPLRCELARPRHLGTRCHEHREVVAVQTLAILAMAGDHTECAGGCRYADAAAMTATFQAK
mgnify:CR=1 FL=1